MTEYFNSLSPRLITLWQLPLSQRGRKWLNLLSTAPHNMWISWRKVKSNRRQTMSEIKFKNCLHPFHQLGSIMGTRLTDLMTYLHPVSKSGWSLAGTAVCNLKFLVFFQVFRWSAGCHLCWFLSFWFFWLCLYIYSGKLPENAQIPHKVDSGYRW